MSAKPEKSDIESMPSATVTIARSNAGRKVLEPLRLEILLGDLPAGSRLIETRLAEEYGVSRSSVRSALQVLETEGLIRKLGNGCKEVLGFTRKDALDAHDLRFLLEKRAVEIILDMPEAKYGPLLDVLGYIERSRTPARKHRCDWHLVDIRFHKAIVETAGNGPLLKAWDVNAPLVYSLMTLNTSGEYHDRYIDEFFEKHKRIFDSVITRNPDIHELLKVHVDDAKIITSGLFDRIEAKKKH